MSWILLVLTFCYGVVFADHLKNDWEVVAVDATRIAVPQGWRSLDGRRGASRIHRVGDGHGVPKLDETGAPLQIGLTVEVFPPAETSSQKITEELIEKAKRLPQLEIVGQESVETVSLSDKTEAVLLTAEFIKEDHRRSLQMKLIAKDDKGRVWIVLSYLVGGTESQWPTPNSVLSKWLRAHVVSLTLTGADIDQDALKAAYRAKQQAFQHQD